VFVFSAKDDCFVGAFESFCALNTKITIFTLSVFTNETEFCCDMILDNIIHVSRDHE
jgi:hypothetical protein